RDWSSDVCSSDLSKTLLKDPGLSIVTCDYCFAVVKASEVKDGKCPICGKPIKVHEAKPISDVDLVEATRERKARIKQIIQDQVMTNIVDKPVSELKSLSE